MLCAWSSATFGSIVVKISAGLGTDEGNYIPFRSVAREWRAAKVAQINERFRGDVLYLTHLKFGRCRNPTFSKSKSNNNRTTHFKSFLCAPARPVINDGGTVWHWPTKSCMDALAEAERSSTICERRKNGLPEGLL